MFDRDPDQVGHFLIFTDELDRQAVKISHNYSGSGFKLGLFSAHMRGRTNEAGLVMGGSGGALTSACYAMGGYGVGIFDALTGAVDDGTTWDGIDGWLKPAWWQAAFHWMFPRLAARTNVRNPNGLYFSDGIQDQVKQYVDPKKFLHPVGFAVVVRGVGLRVIICGTDTDPELVHAACASSCLIALAMDTPEITIPGVGTCVASDGGHENYLPLPTLELLPNLEHVEGCLATQVGKPVPWPKHKNPLIASLLWFVDTALHVPVARDIADFKKLLAAGVRGALYAPFKDPGGSFDADHEIMVMREKHSHEMLGKPYLSSEG